MTTRYYLGTAVAIPEVKTYLFANTWAAADWASISINGKTLTLTLTAGDTMTTAAVNAAMIDMINGAAANENEVRSALGSNVGEFAILTASAGATTSTLKLTGPSDGRPIGTVTVDSSTAGDGTFTAIGGGDDVTGTGPHHAKDVDNWSGDTVPIAGDTIVFDHQAVAGPKYDMAMGFAPGVVTITDGYRFGIGLPQINRDLASYPFDEHLPTYMTYTSCADVRVNAGNAQAIKLDFGSAATTIVVDGTGRAGEIGVPALCLKANHASNALTVNNGDVGLCIDSTVAGELATLLMGGSGNPIVNTGTAVTLAAATVDSGTLIARTAITTLTINGGSVEQIGGNIGSTTLSITGGTFYPRSAGTHAAVTQSAGTINCTKDSQGRTFTNYYLYGGSLKDPAGTITFTNGIRIYPKLSAVSLDLPPVKKYTLGAV